MSVFFITTEKRTRFCVALLLCLLQLNCVALTSVFQETLFALDLLVVFSRFESVFPCHYYAIVYLLILLLCFPSTYTRYTSPTRASAYFPSISITECLVLHNARVSHVRPTDRLPLSGRSTHTAAACNNNDASLPFSSLFKTPPQSIPFFLDYYYSLHIIMIICYLYIFLSFGCC